MNKLMNEGINNNNNNPFFSKAELYLFVAVRCSPCEFIVFFLFPCFV